RAAAPARSKGTRAGGRGARPDAAWTPGFREGRRAEHRRAEATGDRPRARNRARGPLPRRGDGRPEPRRDPAGDGPGPRAPGQRTDDPHDRAPRPRGGGPLGSPGGPELREEDRRRPARGGAARARGGGRLPRRRDARGGEGVKALEVQGIDVFYRDVQAVWDVSFDVEPGEIVTLVGANGAGKTTTLRTISGLLKPRRGTIRFQGEDVTGLSAFKLVERGL